MELQNQSIKIKVRKSKPTIESVLKELDDSLEYLQLEIDKRKKTLNKNKGLNTFRHVQKNLEHIKKVIPKIAKKTRNTQNNKNNFNKSVSISDELVEFLQVDKDTKLMREEISCAIFTYINIKDDENREKILKWKYLNDNPKRDLRNPEHKDIIIPDDKLSNLLDYNQYKLDVLNKLIKNKKGEIVTDDRLYYKTILKLIQKHINK